MEKRSQARPWRTPEELVEIGFSRARVVMMNEVHSGLDLLMKQKALPIAISLQGYNGNMRQYGKDTC
jgi:hypothetical protein